MPIALAQAGSGALSATYAADAIETLKRTITGWRGDKLTIEVWLVRF
jgi:hypothetical protein